jgi:hypothetical protein
LKQVHRVTTRKQQAGQRADEEAAKGGDEEIQEQRHGSAQVSAAVKAQTP